MALKAGYKGFKKLRSPLKLFRPGELGIDQDALVEDLNPVFFTRSDQVALGASWNELNVTANGKTENGVTFTINADKSVTFVTDAGGATADTSIVFNPDYQITDANTHYYSGISNGGAYKYYLECYYRDNSNTYKGNTRVYDGVVPINVSDKTEATKINTFILMVKSGFVSTTPITVYPMVAPKADALYAPYAMTNQELTDKVFIRNAIASNTDLDNVLDTGVYWDYGNTAVHAPENVSIFVLYVTRMAPKTDANQCVYQTLINTSGASSQIYQRRLGGAPATWSPWYKFTGTEVSANREADPDETPATPSTKKTTKKTASADKNE